MGTRRICINRRKSYNRSLDVATSFNGVQSKRVSKDRRGIGTRRGHKPKLSLDKGLFLLYLTNKMFINFLQPFRYDCSASVSMGDSFIYRGRGGGWDPYNGGREALSFGSFPQKVETRGQRRVVVVIQSNHSDWLAHEVVRIETLPLYLKKIPKAAWHR